MPNRLLSLFAFVALLASVIAISLDVNTGRSEGAGPAAGDKGESDEVDQGPGLTGAVRHPLFVKVHSHDKQGKHLVTSTTPTGYTPAQMRAYLGLSADGAGQTIAIVDAFDDPNVAADLNFFSAQFGLPPICGINGAVPPNCFNFQKATPQGMPPADAGWSLEIALDVEWAHAIAPKANILLVESVSNYISDLLGAIDYAAQQPGVVVISNSWGSGEFNSETFYDSHCSLTGAVCTFASGDSGNPGLWPAYSRNVIAVGGTTLNLSAGGGVMSETAWGGSGGGISKYEPKPAYQSPVNPQTRRGIPDVSYNADPNTGVAVYDTVTYGGQTGWFQVGGTSAGAPQWAAIVAVTDQLRGASGPLTSASLQAGTVVYGLTAGLSDVTSGTNGKCGPTCTAKAGYDFVTGLGSPRPGIDLALAGAAAPLTPTSTPSPTRTATATPTKTSTATPTPAPSATPSPSPTPLPSATPTLTASATPTPTSTPVPPTATPTPSLTPTSTATPPPTATATPTDSPTPAPTDTPTSTPTPQATPTATNTPSPTPTPTFTPSPTATNTALPTATPTPTATNTALPTFTPTPTATNTALPTATPTATFTPTPTATNTALPTATPTTTFTPTPTATNTALPTATPTFTPTLDRHTFSVADRDAGTRAVVCGQL